MYSQTLYAYILAVLVLPGNHKPPCSTSLFICSWQGPFKASLHARGNT